jgi:universal stress protein E
VLVAADSEDSKDREDMNMTSKHWKRILVVVADPFAKDQPALAKAAAIARRCGATLHLFNTFMLPQMMQASTAHSSEELLLAATRQREERLQRLAGSLRLESGVKCTVRWDHPSYEAIVRQVLHAKPDLLVADSQRHRRLARLVLTNTDWELIRNCPCPLWFVRTARLPRRPNVLVTVDPSHARAKPARLDSLLLAGAGALVAQLGGKVDLLHVCETSMSTLPARLLQSLRGSITLPQAGEVLEVATRKLHELAAAHAIDVGNCHVGEGAVGDVIEAAARRLAVDVLVMGAVSRSRPDAPMIGGTAERVIDHVDCDVLVIKPAGFKTPVAREFLTLPHDSPRQRRSSAA